MLPLVAAALVLLRHHADAVHPLADFGELDVLA